MNNQIFCEFVLSKYVDWSITLLVQPNWLVQGYQSKEQQNVPVAAPNLSWWHFSLLKFHKITVNLSSQSI